MNESVFDSTSKLNSLQKICETKPVKVKLKSKKISLDFVSVIRTYVLNLV